MVGLRAPLCKVNGGGEFLRGWEGDRVSSVLFSVSALMFFSFSAGAVLLCAYWWELGDIVDRKQDFLI